LSSSSQEGRITVKVINGTNPEKVVKSWIYLFAISLKGEEIVQDSAFYRGKRLTFKGLDPKFFYRVACNFEGIPYSSNLFKLSPDTLHKEIEFYVYEKTNSADSLFIRDYHIGVMGEGNTIKLSEVIIVLNLGLKTYFDTAGFKFILPHGGVETFTPIEPPIFETWKVVGDTVVSSFPIYPGESTIAFNYKTPKSNFTISRELPAVIHSFRVLTSRNISVTSPLLLEKEPIKRGGNVFRVYSMKEPGMGVTFEVKRVKKFPIVLPIIIALLILVSVILIKWAKREKLREPDVFDELAELEELWEKGKIDEKTYREKREDLLKRLEAQ
jgi:uncharacterized membrane protein